jgi:hypothetical protein
VTGSSDKFPRTAELPAQSPLFWVSQKDRYLRQLLIRDIEVKTGRKLLVYFANRYENAQIDGRDSALMAELFRSAIGKPVDLLIETSGGLTDATEGLISLITTLTPDLRVIVANAAKSNGTLLCLAARSILMGATSELGPIEPLVQNVPCTILSEPQIAAQNFPLHMFGKHALAQTRKLAKTLLANGMMKGRDAADVERTVNELSGRDVYFSHGSVINHVEAKRLGLNVEYLAPDDEVWQQIWLLYCMYDFDCRRDRYLKLFEEGSVSTAIAVPRPQGLPVPQ